MKQLTFDELLEKHKDNEVSKVCEISASYEVHQSKGLRPFEMKNATHRELLNILGIRCDSDQKNIYKLLETLKRQDEVYQKVHALIELSLRYADKPLPKGKVVANSGDIYRYFETRLRLERQEKFFILLLDHKHQVIGETLISTGTLNKSIVHPRDVFASAIENRSGAIILVHNHPAGDPQASEEDIYVTKRLVEVGRTVGIPVLDHIIVGNDGYFSLSDQKLM